MSKMSLLVENVHSALNDILMQSGVEELEFEPKMQTTKDQLHELATLVSSYLKDDNNNQKAGNNLDLIVNLFKAHLGPKTFEVFADHFEVQQ